MAKDALLESLQGQLGGGILSLSTGFGKTVTALSILPILKKKTIIVVNKVQLMKQWEAEIKKFLPTAKIGFLQGSKNIQLEGDIIITMLQSLSRIDYPLEFFSDFGCVIFDEIHNTGSKLFSKVYKGLCCKYTIGLSATPNRSDGCEYLFEWHIGPVVYKSVNEKRKGLEPILTNFNMASKNYKEVYTTTKKESESDSDDEITKEKGDIQFTRMISELIQMVINSKNVLYLHAFK